MYLRRFLDERFSPGVGAIKIPITGLIQQYRREYRKLKEQGKKITWKAYKVEPGDYALVHFKIPSRSVKNVEYDVCVALVPRDDTRTNSFLDCHVKIFCNAPSFTYSGTAYLFHNLPDPDLGPGGFVEDRFGKSVPVNRITLFESKLDDNAFTQPPVQKNPYNIPMLLDNVTGIALVELTTRVPYFRVMHGSPKITEEKLLSEIKTFGEMSLTRSKQVKLEKEERDRQKAWASTAASGGSAKSTTKTAVGKRTGVKIISGKRPVARVGSIKSKNTRKIISK